MARSISTCQIATQCHRLSLSRSQLLRKMASPSTGKGIIMDKRIIELALETLERRKAAIVTEIAELESQMRGQPKRTPEKPAAAHQSQSERMKAYWTRKRAEATKLSAVQMPAPATRKRRPMTAAEKKALGKRMKAYWANRRAQAAKPAAAKKSGPQSAAARKAVSERMKAYWAKRKAANLKRGRKPV